MNHNSYPSNHEENSEQPNSGYDQWREAMKDVKFQGNSIFAKMANRIIERGKKRNPVKTHESPIAEESAASESKEHISSIGEAIRTLNDQEMENSGEVIVRPKTEIICDRDHIEGQRIDVINKKDRGTMEFSFKLRAPTETITAITTKFSDKSRHGQAKITTPSGAALKEEKIIYEGTSPGGQRVLCDAFAFEKNGMKVFIAKHTSRDGFNQLVQTAKGLIKVEAPANMNPEETEQVLGEILEKDLGIPDALDEVPKDAERDYKLARYRWQHAITGELTSEQVEQAEKMDREEVFPGYTTFTERGKYKEYLSKYGEDIRAVHQLRTGDAKSIYRVLTRGLMCTTERYSRGIMREGMSSMVDMETGGADSVFTRIANAAQRASVHYPGVLVVFKPEIFDRTDWYSYHSDQCGTTSDEEFARRLSPDGIFRMITSNGEYPAGNEQMFRTGIGANYIESIEVNPNSRHEIITELHSMGLEEVGGRPIEEIVVAHQTTESKMNSKTSTLEQKNKAEPFIDLSGDPEDWVLPVHY